MQQQYEVTSNDPNSPVAPLTASQFINELEILKYANSGFTQISVLIAILLAFLLLETF